MQAELDPKVDEQPQGKLGAARHDASDLRQGRGDEVQPRMGRFVGAAEGLEDRGVVPQRDAQLRRDGEPYVVAGAVVVAQRSRKPSELRTRLTSAVKAWVTWATPAMMDRVGELLDGRGLRAPYALWIELRAGAGRARRSR
jgi:hypothetical protein